MGRQELERVDLEEDRMEEQVPGLRPLKGILHQTFPDKILHRESIQHTVMPIEKWQVTYVSGRISVYLLKVVLQGLDALLDSFLSNLRKTK